MSLISKHERETRNFVYTDMSVRDRKSCSLNRITLESQHIAKMLKAIVGWGNIGGL